MENNMHFIFHVTANVEVLYYINMKPKPAAQDSYIIVV